MAVANEQQVSFSANPARWQGRLAIEYADPPEIPSYFRWKGVFDRVVAAILLIAALPLIGILALKMRLTSGGSGIFRPEVTRPLGIDVPVLAWGLGIDRMALVAMGLNDLRDLFTPDLEQVRLRRRRLPGAAQTPAGSR